MLLAVEGQPYEADRAPALALLAGWAVPALPSRTATAHTYTGVDV